MYGATMKALLGTLVHLGHSKAKSMLRKPQVFLNESLHTQERIDRPPRMRSRPTRVELEVTNRCNYSCVHCLRSVHLKDCAFGDVSFENFRRIVAQFPYATHVSLRGIGEPLLHPLLFDLAAEARRTMGSATISIETNGSLLDRAMTESILASELNEVIVGIDAGFPKTYRKVRRGGSLDAVQRNLCDFVEMRAATDAKKPALGVSFVMLEENEGELVPFLEQTAEMGVDFVERIGFAVHDWGAANRRSLESFRQELRAGQRKLEQLRLPCRSFPSSNFAWARERPFDCENPWGASVYVTFEGEITLGGCTPFKELYSYGNILTTPFEEIWNGPLFRYNRERTRDGVAPNPSCAACHANATSFFDPRNLDARVIRLPLLPQR